MNRRDSLRLIGAGAAGLPLPALAMPAGVGRAAVFDSRFAHSRHFAPEAGQRFDCSRDMAQLWFADLLPGLPGLLPMEGLTCAADARIAADCARAQGLRLEVLAATEQAPPLVHWRIDLAR